MIVTSRLELRPFTIPLASAIAADDRADQQWATGFPREDDRDAARMFLLNPSEQFGSYTVQVTATGETVGTIGFFGPPDPDGTVMIGYGVVEQARGSGYATEALQGLLTYAKSRPEVNRIVADTDADNVASQRVLEKTGFHLTGHTDKSQRYILIR